MLFGTEPLGYEMSLVMAKKVAADSDLEQVQLQRHSNYFHKLCAEEKLELEKEKFRKVKITLNRPKSASAAFNAIMEQQFSVLDAREQVRTEMGFAKKNGYAKPKEEKEPLRSAGASTVRACSQCSVLMHITCTCVYSYSCPAFHAH